MENILIISIVLIVMNLVWTLINWLRNSEIMDLTKFLMNKTDILAAFSKELDIADLTVKHKIKELSLLKKMNDELFFKHLTELYLGATDLKRFTEQHVKTLDFTLDRELLLIYEKNLKKLDDYILSIRLQTDKDLNDVNCDFLNVRYKFSEN